MDFLSDLKARGQMAVSDAYFDAHHKDLIYIESSSKKHVNLFHWNDSRKFWQPFTDDDLATHIATFVDTHVKQLITGKSLSEIADITKQTRKYTDTNICKQIGTKIKSRLKNYQIDIKFEPELDETPDVWNFANKIVNLRTGIARDRIREDYISQFINIDYTDEIDTDVAADILKLFHNTLNNNWEQVEAQLL